jgi:hypothetical protein
MIHKRIIDSYYGKMEKLYNKNNRAKIDIKGYYIIGIRPVKTIKYTNGSLGIQAFNWDTGKFEFNYRYLEHVFGFYTGDVETEEIAKEYFDRYVAKLKEEKGFN